MNNSLTLMLPGLVVAVVALALFMLEAFLPGRRLLAWVAAGGLALGGVLAALQWLTLSGDVSLPLMECGSSGTSASAVCAAS